MNRRPSPASSTPRPSVPARQGETIRGVVPGTVIVPELGFAISSGSSHTTGRPGATNDPDSTPKGFRRTPLGR